MKPLQLSTETVLKLSQELKIPLEQLMHLPQHILIKKLMEVENKEKS